ncbi:MAG: hypothetical protein JRJ87_14415 [Deltaproteobacteria bacterium]|nr:hypothetical protein [Deltaproteobacteria bacterium]
MANKKLLKAERNKLIKNVAKLDEQLYPSNGDGPSGKKYKETSKSYYQAIEDYFERLPRVQMSVCPYCGKAYLHSFDPFGLDGLWWHEERLVTVNEPPACEHFRLILGAYKITRTDPSEATGTVRPGPEVPFVVPDIIDLPGMRAVVGRLEMKTGDIAYPIVYFSDVKTRAIDLCAPWLKVEYWFKDEHGNSAWNISNDEWSFDLEKYIEDKRLGWVDLTAKKPRVETSASRECPFVGTEGVRQPQIIYSGDHDFLELPTGEIVCPFE